MGIPRVSFAPGRPSRYLFRRQPRAECLSTIEAVHRVIDLLDRPGGYPVRPTGAHENLLEVFDWMAERQSRRSMLE
jgi:DTW domain-containing protein YfiP